MRPWLFAIVAVWLLPGLGLAQDGLKPQDIIEFFTHSETGEAGSTADVRTRSVHVGPTGFGSGADSATKPPIRDERVLNLLVTFELDSARLTKAARANLDAFAQALDDPALAGLRFGVEGHTDAIGPDDYNLGLSEKRAAAVLSYLTANGVDPARLVAQGFGETRPRAADPFAAENRRVETRRLP